MKIIWSWGNFTSNQFGDGLSCGVPHVISLVPSGNQAAAMDKSAGCQQNQLWIHNFVYTIILYTRVEVSWNMAAQNSYSVFPITFGGRSSRFPSSSYIAGYGPSPISTLRIIAVKSQVTTWMSTTCHDFARKSKTTDKPCVYFSIFTYSTKFQFNLYSNQFMSVWKLWSYLKLWPSSCELMINPQTSSQFQLFRGFSVLEKANETRVAPTQYMVNDNHKGIVVPKFLYPMSQPLLPMRCLEPSKKNGTSRPN